MLLKTLFFLWLCFDVARSQIDPVEEDANLSALGLLRKYGYPNEEHKLLTEDGYRLNMHRIPRPGAKPVLVMHGLMDSSAGWLLMGPGKGLGYLLYDRGYDVWLGNTRGNTYSRTHVKYTVDMDEFWDFSFHEMALFDLPLTIDYVLEKTNRTRLQYIGHSQGTTIFWIMGSEKPEYMEKIILMQGMAPIAYFRHSKSPVMNFLAASNKASGGAVGLLGPREFPSSSELVDKLGEMFCVASELSLKLCKNMMFLVEGFNREQMNETSLPIILGHAPAGASTKQIMHFLQFRNSNKFQQYDYGFFQNTARYSSFNPPLYDLSRVTARVALYYGHNDWLAQPLDVTRLYFQLPNAIFKYQVDLRKFNHLDFLWAIDAPELVYKKIFKTLDYFDRVAEKETLGKN